MRQLAHILLIVLFLLGIGNSFAQQQKDSYDYKRQKSTKNSSYYSPSVQKKKKEQPIDVGNNLKKAKKIYTKSSKEAIELVQEALVESKLTADTVDIVDCYLLLGEINKYHNQSTLAEKNYQKSSEYALASNQTYKYYSSIRYLAQAQLKNNKLSEATKNAESLRFVKASSTIRSDAYEVLGEVQYRENNYEQAIVYFNRQKELEAEKKGARGRANANLAKVYAAMNEVDKSEELLFDSYNSNSVPEADTVQFFRYSSNGISTETATTEPPGFKTNEENNSEKALENELDDLEIKEDVFEIQEEVLVNYRQQGLIEKEIEVREELLKNKDYLANDKATVTNQLNLGEAYLERGDYEEAVVVLNESQSYQWSDVQTEAKSVKLLSEALSKTGRNDLALKQYQRYVELQDKVIAEKEQNLIANNTFNDQQNKTDLIESEFDVYVSDLELLREKELTAKAQYRTQKFINYGLIFLLILISIGMFFIYRNAKEKRKANQLLALKSLRSQMNPHFIFNALNSVNSFISKNDERSANKFLTDFSKLMRMVLDSSHEDLVPLHQEMNVIDLYLKLEQYRFRDKFDYELDISGDIDQESFMIPPMLIQPFIENAVWHGLRYKEEFGKLHVKIKHVEDKILVEVEDDGIGRERSAVLKTKNQKSNASRGLQNTKERISVINDLYSTSLDLKVEDVNRTDLDKGTKVQLTIPQIA